MEVIYIILGVASLVTLIQDFIFEMEDRWTWLQKMPRKPFKCAKCFGFWISILPFTLEYGLMGVIYSALVAITAEIMYKHTSI